VEKKQVTALHPCHPRRRNQVMHQQSWLKIVMMILCQTSTETYRGKKTSNSDASASSKKKKSSDASAKPAEDSDDDFMPDKHGNLPWKKKC